MLKILEPIEKKHRRVTQKYGENFKVGGRWMYGDIIKAWPYHMGIDYSSKVNGVYRPLPIRAGFDGKAIMKTNPRTYGNYIELYNGEYKAIYGHLSKFEGSSRDVKAGEIIGYTGNTGAFSTAPHLHFGVKKNGAYFNFTNLLTDEVKPLSKFEQWLMEGNKRNIAGLAFVILDKYGIDMEFKQLNGREYIYGIIDGIQYRWHLNETKDATKEKLSHNNEWTNV